MGATFRRANSHRCCRCKPREATMSLVAQPSLFAMPPHHMRQPLERLKTCTTCTVELPANSEIYMALDCPFCSVHCRAFHVEQVLCGSEHDHRKRSRDRSNVAE